MSGTPNEILDRLRKVLVANPSETYTVVFFKPDGSSGPAVTPYAIENKGGGKYDVLIYDNNWPTVPRAMTFDTKADTWIYDAAINPKQRSELYKGDAESQSLFLFPTSPGLGVQPCPSCGKRASKGDTKASSIATEEIFLNGGDTDHADLLITDDAGHRLGYADGKLVNEIPGAGVEQLVENQDWNERIEPRFAVPAGMRYTIVVDGSTLRRADRRHADVDQLDGGRRSRSARATPPSSDR